MQTSFDTRTKRIPSLTLAVLFFAVAFAFSLWAATVGWTNGNLRGVEFRQAQTALSTYFIQTDHDFGLAYPTPVLGKPWSIPMEFPLYQWSVAVLSNSSGLDLTSSARVVSLLCFYLTLPAVFLLLGEWKLAPCYRWLILGLIVSCPLYIFYSRAFLIETMALMMSLWFLLTYWRAVKWGKWTWLLAANVFGIAAGLTKVTTYMLYLVPAAVGTASLLWQDRPSANNPGWMRMRRTFCLGLVATALPFVVTLWWLHFADAVKMLNPTSRFLVSSNLTGYNLGTTATRFAAKIWAGHWRIFSESVVWLPLVVVSGVALLFGERTWRPKVFSCVALFLGAQVLFPELYAWHDYYYVANTVFLLVAMGLSIVALFEAAVPRWICGVIAIGMLGGQVYFYSRQFYPEQSAYSPEGSDLTRALLAVTRRDDVLLIQGEDWNSMIPYYSRRRALMLRDGTDRNETEIREAFANLKGESIGALITTGEFDKSAPLLKLAVEYFGIKPEPVLKWRGKFIYFSDDRWDQVYEKSQLGFLHDVDFIAGGRMAQAVLSGRWLEVKKLRRYELGALKYLSPEPVSFYVRFGLSLTGSEDAPQFGVHPETRLRFALSPGDRHLKTSAGLSPGAYENLPPNQASDGVDVTLTIVKPGVPDRVVYSRNLNPRDIPEDRGAVPIDVDFEMPPEAELELSVTSGPAGSDLRDWAYLGRLKIE